MAVIEKRRFDLYKNTIWEKPSDAIYSMIRGAELYLDGGYTNVKLDATTYGEWDEEEGICYGCYAMLAIFDTDNMVISPERATGILGNNRNYLRHEENPKFSTQQYEYSERAIDCLRTRELQGFLAYWMDLTTAAAWLDKYDAHLNSAHPHWGVPFLMSNFAREELEPYRRFADWLKERGF